MWSASTDARRRAGLERGSLLWALILGVATVVEVDGIRHPGTGGTLSEVTRKAWRTSTPAGRALFTVAWAAFAGWFVVHITGGDGSSSTS